jgi:hypothetical protein
MTPEERQEIIRRLAVGEDLPPERARTTLTRIRKAMPHDTARKPRAAQKEF